LFVRAKAIENAIRDEKKLATKKEKDKIRKGRRHNAIAYCERVRKRERERARNEEKKKLKFKVANLFHLVAAVDGSRNKIFSFMRMMIQKRE
jgi:hypothetical protein